MKPMAHLREGAIRAGAGPAPAWQGRLAGGAAA
jgi:hypothetical protein